MIMPDRGYKTRGTIAFSIPCDRFLLLLWMVHCDRKATGLLLRIP
jgi:hypothetical protein